jgi:hypothetical protein
MARENGIITENITQTIRPGQMVYDSLDKPVGSVDFADGERGYVTVKTNPFTDDNLYIPFRLVTNSDPRELFLALPKDDLRRHYSSPPPRSTRVDWAGSRMVATTTEPSGYDGRPVVIDRVRLDQLKDRIPEGGHVFTAELTDLGTIERYDPVTGWMRIQRAGPSKQEIVIPITLVDYVNRQTKEVYLTVTEADLQKGRDS